MKKTNRKKYKTGNFKTNVLVKGITFIIIAVGSAFGFFSPSFSSSVPSDLITEVNNNRAEFSDREITTVSFEEYGELDSMGRCTVATACLGPETLPTEKRGAIGMIKPSGWHTIRYDNVDGKYLYNRCHLIAYELSGENANRKNLITGTRYLNIKGMLPYENKVTSYIKKSGNHVMYRVTPHFTSSNLLCDGVKMEGYSVEDKGRGISFNIFVKNIQPGIDIDYATGNSRKSSETAVDTSSLYKHKNKLVLLKGQFLFLYRHKKKNTFLGVNLYSQTNKTYAVQYLQK